MDADDMTNLNKGSLFLILILTMMGKIQTAATSFTTYKDLLLTGKGGGVDAVWIYKIIYRYTNAQIGNGVQHFLWL